MYINTTTFEVLSESQIRAANTNTSFNSQFVPPEGYAYIFPAPKPEMTVMQMALSLPPVQVSLGHWEEQWEVAFKYNDYTDSEGVLHTRVEQEEAATEAARVAAVPKSVTRRQAKQALLLAGLLGNVQPALDAIPDATQRGLMQLEWDESLEFERNRPSLLALAAGLGLDGAALDQLFITAAAL